MLSANPIHDAAIEAALDRCNREMGPWEKSDRVDDVLYDLRALREELYLLHELCGNVERLKGRIADYLRRKGVA